MTRRLPNLAIVLLLVGQGLLVTSGLWHRHGPDAGPRSGHAADAGGAACHHHHDSPADDRERAPAAPAGEDDDCAICLIVATQRIDVIERGEVVAPAPAARMLRPPPAQMPGPRDRAPPRSRGPPTFNRA